MSDVDGRIVARVRLEIEALHAFISGWIRGDLDHSADLFAREFAARFAPGFVNIQPAGRVLSRADLIDSIRSGYGANPAFEISIADCVVRWADGPAPGGVLLATYLETQRGAKNTSPPENTRISSGLFEARSDGERFSWLHLHETLVVAGA